MKFTQMAGPVSILGNQSKSINLLHQHLPSCPERNFIDNNSRWRLEYQKKTKEKLFQSFQQTEWFVANIYGGTGLRYQ
jgi:hypothetical protein